MIANKIIEIELLLLLTHGRWQWLYFIHRIRIGIGIIKTDRIIGIGFVWDLVLEDLRLQILSEWRWG